MIQRDGDEYHEPHEGGHAAHQDEVQGGVVHGDEQGGPGEGDGRPHEQHDPHHSGQRAPGGVDPSPARLGRGGELPEGLGVDHLVGEAPRLEVPEEPHDGGELVLGSGGVRAHPLLGPLPVGDGPGVVPHELVDLAPHRLRVEERAALQHLQRRHLLRDLLARRLVLRPCPDRGQAQDEGVGEPDLGAEVGGLVRAPGEARLQAPPDGGEDEHSPESDANEGTDDLGEEQGERLPEEPVHPHVLSTPASGPRPDVRCRGSARRGRASR